MVRITTVLTLSLSILGATANDCPSDRFPDCCASYGIASLDTMKNSFNVPIGRITKKNTPVGYVCEYLFAATMITR